MYLHLMPVKMAEGSSETMQVCCLFRETVPKYLAGKLSLTYKNTVSVNWLNWKS